MSDTTPVPLPHECYDVYLPAPGAPPIAHGLASGAAVIGTADEWGHVRLYVEPASRDSDIVTWADRVHRAAARARLEPLPNNVVPPDEVVLVARYDYRDGEVQVVDEHVGEVSRWLGFEGPATAAPGFGLLGELQSTRPIHAKRRELRSMLAAGRLPRYALERVARQAGHEDLLDEGWEHFVDDWDWAPVGSEHAA